MVFPNFSFPVVIDFVYFSYEFFGWSIDGPKILHIIIKLRYPRFSKKFSFKRCSLVSSYVFSFFNLLKTSVKKIHKDSFNNEFYFCLFRNYEPFPWWMIFCNRRSIYCFCFTISRSISI